MPENLQKSLFFTLYKVSKIAKDPTAIQIRRELDVVATLKGNFEHDSAILTRGESVEEALKKFPADAPKGKQLTGDGVHMNSLGNIMMARGVAKAFGLTDAQLDESEKNWKK